MICRCPHCGSRFKPENRHGTIGYLVYRCPECSQDSFVSPHRIAAVSGICLLAVLGGWLVVLAMIIGCSRAGLAVPRFLLLFVAPFTMLVAVVIAAKSRHGLLDPLTRDKTVPGVLSLSLAYALFVCSILFGLLGVPVVLHALATSAHWRIVAVIALPVIIFPLVIIKVWLRRHIHHKARLGK